jgi:ATP-dependent 26S proteasome regulatory subunit
VVPIYVMCAQKQVWSFLLVYFLQFSGLFAIRAEREYVVDEDFMKAVRKVGDAKKLESKLDYKPM